ncbi:MAG: Tad domain-containing protein [Chloroflexi bacterium]|nr:Tad domain-containing protein [Chloroflexota bacterium]
MRRLLQCDRHSRLWRPGVARPGQSLVIAALTFTALMGMVALGVDIGNLWLQQRMLRTIADGAALVGAQGYDAVAIGSWPVTSAGLDAAKNYAETKAGVACGFGAGATEPCKIISPVAAYGGQGDQYIQVIIRKTVPFSFARVLGFASQDLTLTSTARTNRPQPSDFAVIALDSDPTARGIVIEAGAIDEFYRVGDGSDMASHRHIQRDVGAAGTILVLSGSAYYTDQLATQPGVTSPRAVYEPSVGTLAPDPHVGFSFPTPPAGCGTWSPQPDPLQPGWEVVCGGGATVGGTAKIRLLPGTYGTITLVSGARIQFTNDNNGSFRIDQIISQNFDRDNPVSIQMFDTSANAPGVYIEFTRGISLTEYATFDLKGRPNARDVVFHYIGAPTTIEVINLNNKLLSLIKGSIYSRDGGVRIRGNACNVDNEDWNRDRSGGNPDCGPAFSRVTRGLGGGGSVTQRGGQVVARYVRLYLDPSTRQTGLPNNWGGVSGRDSWGVDYPPINTNRQPAPTLIPNAP